jgi:polyhydroxyalkanoate synthesis repressor PhaR
MADTKVIKRYANRKLYDVEASKYTTLTKIVDEVKAGRNVQVLDNVSKEDITYHTLLTALVETADMSVSSDMLVDILRAGGLTQYVNGIQTIARLAGV